MRGDILKVTLTSKLEKRKEKNFFFFMYEKTKPKGKGKGKESIFGGLGKFKYTSNLEGSNL